MMGTAMGGHERGVGEAADRTRRRRLWTLCGALFAVGVPLGFLAARLEKEGGGALAGALPPWFALLAAAVLTVAIVWGSVAMHRRVDELERRDNRIAAVMGYNALIVGYPVWYVLWRGGLVGEPRHEVIYLAVFATTFASYLFLKLRQRF